MAPRAWASLTAGQKCVHGAIRARVWLRARVGFGNMQLGFRLVREFMSALGLGMGMPFPVALRSQVAQNRH